MQTICLGPYQIESSLGPGPEFIDHSKSKRVAVIEDCSIKNLPSQDAVLLYEENKCDNSGCVIRWYECPSDLGRIYTILFTGCEVIITSFEDGLLNINECDASIYGAEKFCFGKIYDSSTHNSSNPCYMSFIFDGHLFKITGQKSLDYGLFNCSDCQELQVFDFNVLTSDGGTGQDLPSIPPTYQESEISNPKILNPTLSIIDENATVWHNSPEGDDDVGQDVYCNPEEKIFRDDVCTSQNHPSVAILPSGQAIVAYEDRDKDGLTKISLTIFKTTVKNNVKYFRSLGMGRLINNPQLNYGQLEIFDDVLLDSNADGTPDETIFIGFLSGPLRGASPFQITQISRVIERNRQKQTILFDLGEIIPTFNGSNDVSDVKWFIITTSDAIPQSSILLPNHLNSSGVAVPVANPSIAVAKNNLGLNTDQHVFISYQAYVNKKWNIYVRHVILSDKTTEPPTYLLPYQPRTPTLTQTSVLSDFSKLNYHVVQISSLGGKFCSLFEVRTINDEPVYSGLTGSGFTNLCGFSYQKEMAYVEASFDTNLCGINVPDWQIGSVFTGDIPPIASQIGWTGSSECVDISTYPGVISWYYNKPICRQTNLIDDPYCSDPYITVTYKPEELYTLKIDNQIITRVLYHLDANVNISSQLLSINNTIDFMFLVDYSGSMGSIIDSLRLSIAEFTQSLNNLGINFRFGFTIYATGTTSSGSRSAVNPVSCCGDQSWVFDAIDFQGSDGSHGFSNSLSTLDNLLQIWNTGGGGGANHFGSVQFVLNDSRWQWRDNAQRFIMLITDAQASECSSLSTCGGYLNNIQDAIDVCNNNNCSVILAIRDGSDPTLPGNYTSQFEDLSTETGWQGGVFPVKGTLNRQGIYTYSDVLSSIVSEISNSYTVGVGVFERNNLGYEPDFLKRSKVLITYESNLIDIWTQEKYRLLFEDTLPFTSGATKGLSNFPFDIHSNQVFNIDPVHVFGDSNYWVYFDQPGQFKISYPNVGSISPSINDPILISENSTRSSVFVNNRNDVFVAYENFDSGNSQIHIKATGDFSQNSITGAKSDRITKHISSSDFSFFHEVTLPYEGVNQLCDIVIDDNDIVHLVWQSSRDSYWEVYYANGYDLFLPVRVTRSKSRSGYPRIDVDKNGCIYVVYHDNRFGPYDIMLSYKDVKRMVPLLQQDPYLSSLSLGYKHYTNTIPITISNPITYSPLPGSFVASKISTGTGNTSENAIFNLENGVPVYGSHTDPWSIVAMSGSTDGFLYGISGEDAYGERSLLVLDEPEVENPYISVEVNEFTEIGKISLDGSFVSDMAVDQEGRIWGSVIDVDDLGQATALRLVNFNKDDASIVTDTVISTQISSLKCGLAVKPDGTFFVSVVESGAKKILSSSYPNISGSFATFNFSLFNTSEFILQSLTVDENGDLYGLSDLNIYLITDVSMGLVHSISDGYDLPDPYVGIFPIGEISGFAYQFSGKQQSTGNGGYFNIFIEFYDNINFDGSPVISIDSRKNLDAFLSNYSDLEDPYSDVYFQSARGVFLSPGQSKVVIFDASLSRPETENLVYPYGFDTNITYFPRAFLINPSGEVTSTEITQLVSFSCHKCQLISTNNPDFYACSFSFIVNNSNLSQKYFNFQVDFFSDSSKQSIIKRFYLTPGHPDLQYVEVNNITASSKWASNGLPISAGDSVFIQIYPTLSAGSEFICGINYFVRVQDCSNSGEVPCSDFVNKENVDWDVVRIPVSASEEVSQTDPTTSSTFGETVAFAWKSSNSDILFTTLETNTVEVIAAKTHVGSGWSDPSIFEINGTMCAACVYNPVFMFESATINFFQRQSPGNWTSSTVTTIGSNQNNNNRVILRETPENQPCILYTSPQLFFAEFNGSNWVTRQLDNTLPLTMSMTVIDNSIYIHWENPNGSSKFVRKTDGEWSSVSIGLPGYLLLNGSIMVVENQLFIFVKNLLLTEPNIQWATSPLGDGLNWTIGGTVFTTSESLWSANSLSINGIPHIVYLQNTYGTSYNLKLTKLVTDLSNPVWDTIFIDQDINIDDFTPPGTAATIRQHPVAISEYLGSLTVFTNLSPARVYLNSNAQEITAISSGDTFFCECASSVHDNPVLSLGNIDRWHSSGSGFSDTRVTDSVKDSLKPTIKTRSSDGAFILFEDYNVDQDGRILGASFYKSNVNEVFGSGTRSWFDYDLNITGRGVDATRDFYDRSISVYEKLDSSFGKSISNNELKGSTIAFKSCGFETPSIQNDEDNQQTACFESLESNIISKDDFINRNLINKAIVSPAYASYYTYNSSGQVASVVSNCQVMIQIWIKPEIIAVRMKNENSFEFGSWTAVTPEINQYYIEKMWSLSKGSGVKEVCIQGMTYSGVTGQICVPIIADYGKTIFELKIYSDSEYSKPLPTHNGMFVASTKLEDNGNAKEFENIFVEIIPNDEVSLDFINFDVIQQGANDQIGIKAMRSTDSKGRVVFRGKTTIYKEDKVFNIDGLTRIRANIPGACDSNNQSSKDQFTKDINNLMSPNEAVQQSTEDILERYRQEFTGLVGVGMSIRPNEDPYLIFGDPNIFFTKNDMDQPSIKPEGQ